MIQDDEDKTIRVGTSDEDWTPRRSVRPQSVAHPPEAPRSRHGSGESTLGPHNPARWEDGGPGVDPGEPEYRRPSRPVRVQRGRINPAVLRRLRSASRVALRISPALLCALVLYDFATTSPQFALASSDQIEVAGITHVARAQVIDRFASDLGRNIFFIPLERRLGGIRQIAWVRSAAVLRIWPNRLQVRIAEREPVAFARFGSTLQLIDADGVLLDRSRVSERPPSSQNADQRHDFPVLVGLPRGDAALSERRERVRQYVGLTQELDSGETPHSQDLSEVNLSDPDDMQVTVTSPNSVTVIIHLGDHDFLRRYNLYLNHIEEWRHAFPRLSSVDLRYSGQAIINQQ